MMASMKALPAQTVRLIGSSQVITSVVSVVKELVENSLDASATSIEIKLEDYGFAKVEVRDNGSGIAVSDTEFMGQPHYTSKIDNHADLEQLQTYGFRGEALGSLCAVSDVTITTKTDIDPVSSVYVLDMYGKVTSKKPSHLPTGTSVVACNLFKKLPVRKQYYSTTKRKKEELKKVEDLVMSFAVINPEIRISLRHNNDLVWQKNVVPDHRSALISVLSSSIVNKLDHIKKELLNKEVQAEAFLPKFDAEGSIVTRITSDRSFLFVNKRPVAMKELHKVFKTCYTEACGVDGNRWPVGFLSLHLKPSSIDVNVDPNKTKIMFHEKDSLLEEIKEWLSNHYKPSTPEKLVLAEEPALPKLQQNMNFDLDFQLLSQDNTSTQLNQKNNTVLPAENFCVTPVAKSYNHEILECGRSIHRSAIKKPDKLADRDSIDKGQGRDNLMESNNNQLSESFVLNETSFLPKLPVISPDINSLGESNNYSKTIDGSEISLLLPANVTTPEASNSETEQSENNRDNSEHNNISSLLGEISSSEMIDDVITKLDFSAHMSQESRLYSHEKENKNETQKTNIEMSNISDQAASWSKGTALKTADGAVVQPVRLLAPTSNQTPGRKEHNKSKYKLSLDKSIPQVFGQTSLLEVTSKSTIKKPVTAFIHFSKAVRDQVVEENPKASFQDIAKIIGEKWKNLSSEERKIYDDKHAESVKRYKEEMSRVKETLDDSTVQQGMNKLQKVWTSHKRRKLDQVSVHSLIQTQNPSSKKVKEFVMKTVEFNMDMKFLKKRYSGKFIDCPDIHSPKLHLIGQLKSHGVWVCHLEDKLTCFIPIRAKECLIFKKLMQDHVCPVNNLENPIVLNKSVLGGDSYMNRFLEMKKQQNLDGYYYYTDPLLVNNGFKLRESQNTEYGIKTELVAVTRCMPSYGLSDLREVVQTVTDTAVSNPADCRPIKIIHYLQGEAVRISRQLPRLTKQEVSDLWFEVNRYLPSQQLTCFHDKAFLIELFDMDNVPFTQYTQT